MTAVIFLVMWGVYLIGVAVAAIQLGHWGKKLGMSDELPCFMGFGAVLWPVLLIIFLIVGLLSRLHITSFALTDKEQTE